jgi:hypothetical protein
MSKIDDEIDTGTSIALSKSPFTQENMNNIFRLNKSDPERLTSRENSWLEFKESFNFGAIEDYGKTMAGFSNTKGGYIVFGVGNDPRKLIGLKNDKFDRIDSARISENLNDLFSPEIQWELHSYEFQNKSFGIIYAHESSDKPIIATKNGKRNEVKEGEIYYRYRGQTRKIRYAELRQIFEERNRKELNYWVQHIKQISRIGPKNAAIFDTETGAVTGPAGSSFFIDEKLLPQLNFIKEGEFDEKKGAPALKLVGDVKPVDSSLIQPTKTVIQEIGIRTPDIIYAFLDQKIVSYPETYIKQICFETSAFLPVYYFMKLANLTRKRTLEILEGTQSTSKSRDKIIERLKSDDNLSVKDPNPKSKYAEKKILYKNQIIERNIAESLPPEELKCVLLAIRMLDPAEVDLTYLLPILKNWYNLYYTDKKAKLADYLRRAICFLDKVQNGEAIIDE